MKKNAILELCVMAISMALFIVLDKFSINLGGVMKISLSGLPIIICAAIYGPRDGFLVGLLGAFISQIFSEYGLTVTTLLWCLPHAARGLLVGFVGLKYDFRKHIVAFIITIFISGIMVTLLNTFASLIDARIFGYESEVTKLVIIANRLFLGLASSVVYSIVSPIIIKVVPQNVLTQNNSK